MVRSKGPGAKVVDEAMFLRVLMDIGDQLEEERLVYDGVAFEGFLK